MRFHLNISKFKIQIQSKLSLTNVRNKLNLVLKACELLTNKFFPKVFDVDEKEKFYLVLTLFHIWADKDRKADN